MMRERLTESHKVLYDLLMLEKELGEAGIPEDAQIIGNTIKHVKKYEPTVIRTQTQLDDLPYGTVIRFEGLHPVSRRPVSEQVTKVSDSSDGKGSLYMRLIPGNQWRSLWWYWASYDQAYITVLYQPEVDGLNHSL